MIDIDIHIRLLIVVAIAIVYFFCIGSQQILEAMSIEQEALDIERICKIVHTNLMMKVLAYDRECENSKNLRLLLEFFVGRSDVINFVKDIEKDKK